MSIRLDLTSVPFSRYGSYISLSRPRPLSKTGAIFALNLHHSRGTARRHAFRIDAQANGRTVPFTTTATPTKLTVRTRRGSIDICFGSGEGLRFHGHGIGLRLQMEPGPGIVAHPHQDGRWVVNARQSLRRFLFEPIRGSIGVDAPWKPNSCDRMIVHLRPDALGRLDACMDVFNSTWVQPVRRSFEAEHKTRTAEFAAWLRKMPSTPARWRNARELAAYIDWSCVVYPEGFLKRDAMFMSKNWMDQVWSWDHVFNAMALSYRNPALALDQMMIMVDQQDEFGAYPDAVNDGFRHYNFSKPPVHGWGLHFMMEKQPRFFAGQRIVPLFESLCRFSQWWLDHRRMPGDELPHYLHGNDSGWDNSTMFDQGVPLIAPDLAAVLSVQLQVLADIARRLGRTRDAGRLAAQSDSLKDALLDQLWRGDKFVAIRRADLHVVDCDSLIPCMPIVLGRRLPQKVRTALVEQIRRFVTAHGVATELPDSPHYEPDGYWRGPVWAPSTLLIASGLAQIGEIRLAREISENFCRTCARHGFPENHNALTGAPLRDRGYTWTSSAFLIMAHEYCTPNRKP